MNNQTLGILIQDFQLGGSERVALRLASAWSRMGLKVVLFCGDPAGPQRHLVDAGIELEIADPPIPAGSLGSVIALGRWISGRLAARRVDTVYLPGNSYFIYVNRLAAAGVRVFVTVTNPLWRADRLWIRNAFFAMLTRWRLRKAHGIASMSPSLLRGELKVHGRRDACGLLPNAIFDGRPDVRGIARRDWHMCAVGRLAPQKNFALLLRSFALLRDLPVTLAIAGDGPQCEELQRLATALGIADRVSFLGAVADPLRCIAEAEVLLLTSDFEGYPAVLVEAMALGTYVVASNCSTAIPDILRSAIVGTVVPELSAAALAQAVRQYFAGPARQQAGLRHGAADHLARRHESMNAARAYLRFMGIEPRTDRGSIGMSPGQSEPYGAIPELEVSGH